MNELKTAMALRGLRPVDLAHTSGISTQQLNNYINEGRPIGPKMAHTFAAILSVSEAYIRGTPQRLAVHDFTTGETVACEIMEEVVLGKYGVYYIVDFHEIGPIAVILSNGVQFTTDKWTEPQPTKAEDIDKFHWVDASGRCAQMVDGLPRLASVVLSDEDGEG